MQNLMQHLLQSLFKLTVSDNKKTKKSSTSRLHSHLDALQLLEAIPWSGLV
jgi:hypothetical protein